MPTFAHITVLVIFQPGKNFIQKSLIPTIKFFIFILASKLIP